MQQLYHTSSYGGSDICQLIGVWLIGVANLRTCTKKFLEGKNKTHVIGYYYFCDKNCSSAANNNVVTL